MKTKIPPGFVLLGFFAVSLITIDLVFRFFFAHKPWPEEDYLFIAASTLLVIYLVVLTRTTVRLRTTEADLRRSGEELQRRVEERTEQLEQANRQLVTEVVERERMEERQRLARDLHDSVAQTLYGISLGINAANSYLKTDQTKTAAALDYALELANDGLTEMRALILELRPDTIERDGLVLALTKRVAALSVRYSIDMKLDLCEEPQIATAAKDALYWIAQEALQNAVKHARASRLDVRLACEQEWLTLEVCDDGSGFDPRAPHPGHLGLRSMRERAERAGGTLEIVSGAGCGTQIRARVPLMAGSVDGSPDGGRRDAPAGTEKSALPV